MNTPPRNLCRNRPSPGRAWAALALAMGLATLPALAVEEPGPAAPKPQRIVSLCVQGDQLLLELVPRERIIALSQFAADPDISANCERAQGIPSNTGGAEALALLQPDLVLTSTYNTRLTSEALKQRGVRVLELDIPKDFDELRTLIRETGKNLGEEAKADAIIAAMDARIERIKARRPPQSQRPAAMFYFQDGFTPGGHTFANAILEIAGFRNLGAQFSPGVGASAPLEAVLMVRPQLLILTRYREARPTQTQISEVHPLFQRLGTQVISVSFRHVSSPDPSNLELAEMLQQYLPR